MKIGYKLEVFDKDRKALLFVHPWFETYNEAKTFMVAQYFFGRGEYFHIITCDNIKDNIKYIYEGV